MASRVLNSASCSLQPGPRHSGTQELACSDALLCSLLRLSPLMAHVFVHQLFLDVGLGSLEDNRCYTANCQRMRRMYPNRYKLWLDADVKDLLRGYPELHSVVKKNSIQVLVAGLY